MRKKILTVIALSTSVTASMFFLHKYISQHSVNFRITKTSLDPEKLARDLMPHIRKAKGDGY